MKKLILILSVFTLLTACASSPYPLGMNQEQWNKLTTEERKALLLEQQKHREQQRLAQIKADAKAKELRLQKEIAEKKRIDAMYNNPSNGNVVMVNILAGQYQYGKRTKLIEEESYQIARGETKTIELRLQEPKKHYLSTERVYLRYTQNGNAIYLYLDNPDYNSSQRIALLRDGRWQCGSRYTKNLRTSYEKLLGIKLFVKEIGSSCGHNDRVIERYIKRY